MLHQLISSGKAPARKLAHARILLKIDRGTPGPEWTDEQVAEMLEVSRYTVIRIRERFVENGLGDALNHRHAPRAYSRALDGEQEAHLIALSCSACPCQGRCNHEPIWNWPPWGNELQRTTFQERRRTNADQTAPGSGDPTADEQTPFTERRWASRR